MSPLGGEQHHSQPSSQQLGSKGTAAHDCVCGTEAVQWCQDCDLSYCTPCATKRHQKGAFQRHTMVFITKSESLRLLHPLDEKEGGHRPEDNNETMRRSIALRPPACDECLHQTALLKCEACELYFCVQCVDTVHQRGTMQQHVMDNQFVYVTDRQEHDESSTTHVADVDKLLQDTDERLVRLTNAITQELHVDNQQQHDEIDLNEHFPKGAFDLETRTDAEVKTSESEQETADPDQEKSPIPVVKTEDTSVDSTSEAYDLWAGWNVREFSERSSSIDDAAQWRGIRSLSIDEKPASPPLALADELTLHSITKSLRSLSYASQAEETRDLVEPPSTRLPSQRPRSFSDYTSLSSTTLHRPKSFSATTSSKLTSPTSSTSSPLNGSIFESPATSSFLSHDPQGRAHSPTNNVSSPFGPSSFGTHRMESPEPWPSMSVSSSSHVGARPRSSSAYESSSLSLDYPPSPVYHNTHMTYPLGYPPQHHHSLHPTYPTDTSPSHHHHPMNPASVFPNRYSSPRTDPSCYRHSNTFMGRHDQGTGEYSLQIDKVVTGDDQRTTLMIRNIPNKYTQQMLLAEINQHHHGQYDFFYLPIDFKNKCNMGYAFINFIQPGPSIVSFYQEFDHQKWSNFNSEKVCAISYARLQGKQAMIVRFQNSSLLDKHESYRPLVFQSTGPQRGQPEPFPSVKQPIHKKLTTSPFLWNGQDEYGRMYLHHLHQQQLQHHAALLTNAHMAAAAMLHGFTPGFGGGNSGSGGFSPNHGTSYHPHQTTDSRLNMPLHGNVPAVTTRPPTNTFNNYTSYAA